MSLLGKNWLIKNTNTQKSALEKVLENRNLQDHIEQTEFHDPFLLNQMPAAIDRIKRALENNERIIIFGDYDVDGISGTALLVNTFKKIGAQVSYRIPHRVNDGYGLTAKFIEDFREKNIGLVITVDCGISGAAVISELKKHGIDTIISDHHHIPENYPSDAIAVLHPKLKDSTYPYAELTGSGVAFKLAHALAKTFLQKGEADELIEKLVDLASLGTVSDLGPLTGENRLIVKKGLNALANSKWVGLGEMLRVAGINCDEGIDADAIGYRIGPRINAAGRIGNPYIPLTLLLQEDLNGQVVELSQKLEELNQQRVAMTTQALEEAESLLLNHQGPLPKILIAEGRDWHVGIVGLVAGRLAEKYGRPVIILQDFDDKLVASARSPECFNIVEALNHCSEHLMVFGGHAQAGGFTVSKDKFEDFKNAINEFSERKLADVELKSTLHIDCEIVESEIGFDLLKNLEDLKPFGIANEKPSFLIRGLKTTFVDCVGSDRKHLKIKANINNQELTVMAFTMGEYADSIKASPQIDLAFQLEINRWNNREFLQLKALDIGLNND